MSNFMVKMAQSKNDSNFLNRTFLVIDNMTIFDDLKISDDLVVFLCFSYKKGGAEIIIFDRNKEKGSSVKLRGIPNNFRLAPGIDLVVTCIVPGRNHKKCHFFAI